MIRKVTETNALEVNTKNIAFAEKMYPGIKDFLPNVEQFYTWTPEDTMHAIPGKPIAFNASGERIL